MCLWGAEGVKIYLLSILSDSDILFHSDSNSDDVPSLITAPSRKWASV